jgi:ectoine hydroxylase-related dioxygenase (phytanoyl-CoA dioxygenase family)
VDELKTQVWQQVGIVKIASSGEESHKEEYSMSVVKATESSHEDLSRHIAGITEEQIETFWKQGWVLVPKFVSEDLCDQVVEHFKIWSKLRWNEWPKDTRDQQEFVAAIERVYKSAKRLFAIRQDDPWMFNYVTQRKFGEAAARLLKVPAVKPLSETLQIKYPSSSGHSKALAWHQDFPNIPCDRAEAVQCWLALVPISEDMGQMVHLTGSHRELPGGMMTTTGEDARELYPELFEKYEVSKPKPLAKGDAIFHHALTWHTSYANETDRVRWAMSSYRISARSIYTGQQNFNTDGLGLIPNKPFDHPNFPTVYP